MSSSTEKQKALFLQSKHGSFAIGRRDVPAPPKGEVLIKVLAAALNPVDWKIQAYGAFVENYPTILGTDIAGEVVSVGEGVEAFKKGDKVFAQGAIGALDRAAFQQYTLIPEVYLCKVPDNISVDEAATIPVAYMVSVVGLFADPPLGAGLNPTFSWEPQYAGQTAVVIGGSSSVGQYVIQLLQFLGFSRIVAYASKRHHKYLQGIGATELIDRGTIPLSRLKTVIGNNCAKVAFDAVSSTAAQQAACDLVSYEGHAITVNEKKHGVNEHGKTFMVVLGSSFFPSQAEFGKIVWRNMEKLVKEGIIKPTRFEVQPGGLNGVTAGLERLRNNQVSGKKLVVHPQETK